MQLHMAIDLSENILIFISSQFYNSFKYRKLFQLFHQTDY